MIVGRCMIHNWEIFIDTCVDFWSWVLDKFWITFWQFRCVQYYKDSLHPFKSLLFSRLSLLKQIFLFMIPLNRDTRQEEDSSWYNNWNTFLFMLIFMFQFVLALYMNTDENWMRRIPDVIHFDCEIYYGPLVKPLSQIFSSYSITIF